MYLRIQRVISGKLFQSY